MPYAQEWRLPLNPEDLELMAVAVLTHSRSTASLDEIDAVERDMIRRDREAHAEMSAKMQRARGDGDPTDRPPG